MAQLVDRAQELVEERKPGAALGALQSAHASLARVRSGIHWLREMAPRWPERGKHLSMVKVRIERARPHSERLGENSPPRVQAWGKLLGRLTAFAQDIDAEILAVHTAGTAYHPQTTLGSLHPARRRHLKPGQTVLLETDRRETGISIGRNEQGKDYWLVIMPPLATKPVPRAIGRTGRSEIVFAMPVRKP